MRNNATLPFALALADKGQAEAMRQDVHLAHGLNIHAGQITHEAVAAALNLPLTPTDKLLAG